MQFNRAFGVGIIFSCSLFCGIRHCVSVAIRLTLPTLGRVKTTTLPGSLPGLFAIWMYAISLIIPVEAAVYNVSAPTAHGSLLSEAMLPLPYRCVHQPVGIFK